MNRHFITASALAGSLAFSCGGPTPVEPESAESGDTTGGKADIYGDDDRYDLDAADLTLAQVEAAESTVALVSRWRMNTTVDGGARLSDSSLAAKQERQYDAPLCPEERFADEPAPGFCSGFLIAPDLVATAAHCISYEMGCNDTRLAFGFHNTDADPTFIPDEDLYECGAIVGHLFDRERTRDLPVDNRELWSDWAVLQLDRPVENRRTVPLRMEPVTDGEPIAAIGHPGGVPTKVTTGQVEGDPEEVWYNTDLDIYRGNSGSLIVDGEGNAVGIASRGSGGTSYTIDEERQCIASRQCDAVDDSYQCFGNQAARIDALHRFIGADTVITPFTGGFSHAIPNDGTPKQVAFETAAEGTIAYVTFNARVWHDEPRTLEFSLVAPDGTRHVVLDRPSGWHGSDAEIVRTTFAFEGVSPTGQWTLEVRDLEPGTVASQHVHSASLVIGLSPD